LSGDDRAENFVLLPKMLIRGKCLSELGRLAEAKQALDAILRNARVADQGELYWLALFERGRIAEREQNFAEAVSYYLRAIKVIEEQRSSINTEANKIGFVGDKQAVYGRMNVRSRGRSSTCSHRRRNSRHGPIPRKRG
jgi:tetratricopeptide (TPR) repeat protein